MGFLFFSCSTQVQKPQKPAIIHNNAAWYGGSDGGSWIYIKKYNQDTFYAQIWFDSEGELWHEGKFLLDKDCKIKSMGSNISFLKTNLQGFDGKRLIIVYNKEYCFLNKIK